MTYAGKSLDEIRREMNQRYAGKNAYSASLPWDTDRMKRLHDAAFRLAHLEGRESGLTLDMGCGDGGIAFYWPHDRTVGVELSDEAVTSAKGRFAGREFLQGAAETFVDPHGRKFDTIVAVETIEHWQDVMKGLANMRSLLAPGGVFVLTTPNADSLHARVGRKLGQHVPFCSPDHTYEFGFDELIYLLEKSGFRVAQSIGVGLAPYWAIDQFGPLIRFLTDRDQEMVDLLGGLGEHIPHVAFCQAHACVVA